MSPPTVTILWSDLARPRRLSRSVRRTRKRHWMGISESHASHIGRVGVDYCLSGDELDPRIVTSSTGLTPSFSARRGDPRLGPNGRKLGAYEIGLWRVSSESAVVSKDVNDHFAFLLERLLPHQGILRNFAAAGRACFFVFWESSYLYAGTGPAIDSRAVSGAAALGASMDFDIYQIDEPTA